MSRCGRRRFLLDEEIKRVWSFCNRFTPCSLQLLCFKFHRTTARGHGCNRTSHLLSINSSQPGGRRIVLVYFALENLVLGVCGLKMRPWFRTIYQIYIPSLDYYSTWFPNLDHTRRICEEMGKSGIERHLAFIRNGLPLERGRIVQMTFSIRQDADS